MPDAQICARIHVQDASKNSNKQLTDLSVLVVSIATQIFG